MIAKLINPVNVTATLLEAGGSADIDAAIEEAVQKRGFNGGIVGCTVTGVPVGLGEPFFDSVESPIGHIVFAIPAVKGLSSDRFGGSRMHGSENNDLFISTDGKTFTNNAGINGGITNGNDLIFRVAVKPTSSTHQKQHTINIATGQMTDLEIEGRHDTCIALRVPPVVEAATALVLADLMMLEGLIGRVVSR
ncbi:MAG: chorismate synthase [Bacteroidales bacterium]